jgi:para-nitrobenzyl esterase
MGKRRLERLLTVAALFGPLYAATAILPQAIAADRPGPVVHTTEGPVQGLVRNGVDEFLGIPYATPPVGDLRWQPPKQHAGWTQTLNATKFGSTCPQITELGVSAGPVSLTEDCLYLKYSSMRRPADHRSISG